MSSLAYEQKRESSEGGVRRSSQLVARARNPLLVQRCGGSACTCPATEHDTAGASHTRPLQRVTVSDPDDASEREAAGVARSITSHSPGGDASMVQRAGGAPGRHSVTSEAIASSLARLSEGGTPFQGPIRASMESRFGRSFNGLRIHTGTAATNLARSLDAVAFTVGRDMVFADGRYAPGTAPGNRLLAHELTHVAQQGTFGDTTVVRRLTASMCSSDCVAPDAVATKPATNWTLKLAVDREEKGLHRLVSGDVGHTWVKFENDGGEKYSFGMWPQVGFNASRPWSSVKGCIHHPDTLHEPPAATEYLDIDYRVAKSNYDAGLAKAQTVCKASPDYNLFSNNCTSFAIEVIAAAGVTPPSSTTLAVHNPNALFEGIEEETAKRATTGSGARSFKKFGAIYDRFETTEPGPV